MIFGEDPMFSWYPLPVIPGFLSVVKEPNDNVKLSLMDSLTIVCDCGVGIKADTNGYNLLYKILMSLPPNVVYNIFYFVVDVFILIRIVSLWLLF